MRLIRKVKVTGIDREREREGEREREAKRESSVWEGDGGSGYEE